MRAFLRQMISRTTNKATSAGAGRIPALAAVAAAGALTLAGSAAAYPWPVKPFDKTHTVKVNFGDPQTVFQFPPGASALSGPGEFSFHNGVDIAAPGGAPAYPVVSGKVSAVGGSRVVVETSDGGTFQYVHISPVVIVGEDVVAQTTILGYVESPANHVHLAEIRGGQFVNPLGRGHLAPYRDKTKPRIESLELRDEAGQTLSPLGIRGRFSIIAEAYDYPALRPRRGWRGYPVTPSQVTWQLHTLAGEVIVPKTTVADFGQTLPRGDDFWTIYARGTYQNMPVLGGTQILGMPGRYLFTLTPAPLDTQSLKPGIYVVGIAATDTRGNTGSLNARFTVARARR